jgi:hypothetical protein
MYPNLENYALGGRKWAPVGVPRLTRGRVWAALESPWVARVWAWAPNRRPNPARAEVYL